MTRTTPTTPNPPNAPGTPAEPTAGSVIAGIGVALLLQVAAIVAAVAAAAVVLVAAFANYGSTGPDQASTWWVIFAVPLAMASLIAYVGSGFAAANVMRTGLGWLTLLLTPVLLLALTVAS